MPNHCSIEGCSSGYKPTEDRPATESLASFHFPLAKPELLQKWVNFTNRRDWTPTASSVICEKHFHEDAMSRGKQRVVLKWKWNPVPTKFGPSGKKRPLVQPENGSWRKPPKVRNVEPDQFPEFQLQDALPKFSDIGENHCPLGFQVHKSESAVTFYKTVFNENNFPIISQAIKIDQDLHVKLQINGNPTPLPKWFIEGHNAKLTKISMLENFPSYLTNTAEQHPPTILDELQKRQMYNNPNGQLPYSPEVLRYALLLRYTSPQCYRRLREQFPLPSFRLLSSLHRGGPSSLEVARRLLQAEEISADVILMADEMYLQESTQYHSGEFYGANETGDLYKGVMVFMIVGLKKSVPVVVRAVPEVSVNGGWLAQEMTKCIGDLIEIGFKVRGLVTDNHAANVAAFSKLLQENDGDACNYFTHPDADFKTYVWFDPVHLVKNIRNNLINGKKFVFPAFDFQLNDINIASEAGYISWGDLHKIHDIDATMNGNLRMARKLTYQSLHPGNKKQNVSLALSVFDETTIAASRSYFPNRPDMSSFLQLINSWWLISNSKVRFHPNALGNAIVKNDSRLKFLSELADWFEEWTNGTSNFCLSKQTGKALILTLRSQVMLMEELLSEEYIYVRTGQLQSDPIERRFSQYRSMSGGRFLVSLREVSTSEKIIRCRSLLKIGESYWLQKDTEHTEDGDRVNSLVQNLESDEEGIMEASLCDNSQEVAHCIAGAIAKKLQKSNECKPCSEMMTAGKESSSTGRGSYLKIISRGGLIKPSEEMSDFVCTIFAQTEYIDKQICGEQSVRTVCCLALEKYAPDLLFACEEHIQSCRKRTIQFIVNTYYKNKQNLSNDQVRRDSVKAFKSRQRTKAS